VYGIPRARPIVEDHRPSRYAPTASGNSRWKNTLALFRRLHDLPYIVLRASNVYGPGKTRSAGRGRSMSSSGTSREASRSGSGGTAASCATTFFIEDLLALFLRCIDTRIGDETPLFNAGSGEGHSLRTSSTGFTPSRGRIEGRMDRRPHGRRPARTFSTSGRLESASTGLPVSRSTRGSPDVGLGPGLSSSRAASG